MRPVNKPLPPSDSPVYKGDMRKGWSANRILQGALADTIDHYCSFCELPINVGDHIEDKRSPGQGQAAGINDWEHLLLSCSYCQQYRLNTTSINETDYLWADNDTTFTLASTSPFLYKYQDVHYVLKHSDGTGDETGTTKLVIVEANASSPAYNKAQRLLNLFQLNSPDYDPKTSTLTFTDSTLGSYPDRRLFLRTEAWELAVSTIDTINSARQFTLSTAPYNMALYNATSIARAYGFWSVWMTVFWLQYHDASLMDRLFLTTDAGENFVIHGYQGLVTTPSQPPPSRQMRPAKRVRPTQTYLLFTGTAKDRITYT